MTDYEDMSYYRERFNENDIGEAFMYLVHTLKYLWSEVDIHGLKAVCKKDIRLPYELKSSIQSARHIMETLDLLSHSPFCTWLNSEILKDMANIINIPQTAQLIRIFEECIHCRKCTEVNFNKQFVNPDYLTLVTAKLNENAENWIVLDLVNYCRKQETILKLPPGSCAVIEYGGRCLTICFVLPKYFCLYAYEIARNYFYKFRSLHIQYLHIENFPKIHTVNLTENENAKCLLREIMSNQNCKF